MKELRILFVTTNVLISIGSVAFAKIPKLSVSPAQVVKYQCDDGKRLVAKYYNLSDKSLNFVKLTLNKTAYTLPQIVSASGVRYSDLHQIEWQTKGREATLDDDVHDDASTLVTCNEVKKKGQ